MDKCPIPGQRFSDKFPTTGTDKMTNAPGRGVVMEKQKIIYLAVLFLNLPPLLQ